MRKRCKRSAVWLPAVTFPIAAFWEWCLSGVWCLHLQHGQSLTVRRPAKTVPHFDPSVFQLSHGCVDVAMRPVEVKKSRACNCTGCTHSSSRGLISASLLLVNASQDPRHRYFAVQQVAAVVVARRPSSKQSKHYHASTKTTSPTLRHPARRPGARARADATAADHAPTRRDPGPAARQGIRLRAQAREGLRRRPPQRHGHGPGWENCGARCGRSQG